MKARFNKAFVLYAIGSTAVGVVIYLYLPERLLPPTAAFMRNLWTVLGPLGAFAVQIVLQLIALGEGKSLNEAQAKRLSAEVDQRLRFVWYVVATTLIALLLSASSASLADIGVHGPLARGIVAAALAFACLSALFSVRLPAILHEIKDYRWGLASDQREADALAGLRRERSESVVEMKEPERRNGTL